MLVDNFNTREFGQNLAQQANELAPKDLDENQRNFVTNKVSQLSISAGDALVQDPNIQLNANQASCIIQFIAEWTFHKGIDLVRANVPSDYWNYILDRIAVSVYEVSKQSFVNKIEDINAITVSVEKEVLKTFEESLKELVKAGKINEDAISNILKFSNIDQMAIAIQEEEKKSMKFAAIAVFLKTLPKDKSNKILASLAQTEAKTIRDYMQMQDLEKKVDHNKIVEYLNGFKKNLIFSDKAQSNSVIKNINNLNNIAASSEIKNIVRFERESIKNFVKHSIDGKYSEAKSIGFSQYISQIIFNYLKMKLTA